MENSQRLPSSNSDKEALYAEWEQWKENEPPGERRAEAVSRMRECYEEKREKSRSIVYGSFTVANIA